MENIKEIVEKCFSINDLCIKLYGYTNGNSIKKVNKLIEENELDIFHFGKGKKNIKYKKINKSCPICGNIFETKEGNRDEKTTCSPKCSNYYFQHGNNNPYFDKEKYEERYKKVSNTLKNNIPWNKKYNEEDYLKECPNCKMQYIAKNTVQKYCSKKCQSSCKEYRKLLSDNVKERIKNGTHKGWQSRNIESYPEKFFKKVLKNNGIEYIPNKTIIKKDYNIEGNGNYFLDFYIKEGNIDLEIDGKQHDYRVEHDNERDNNLSKHFNIYRIKWRSINSEAGKEYIKTEIEKFIKYYNKMKNITLQPQQQIIKPD
jgi:very-short-patch-repair endonuclease/endogenous inhibitor of DNA gyrase (YacG/DUF329 family)